MSLKSEHEPITNSGYCSSDETASLLLLTTNNHATTTSVAPTIVPSISRTKMLQSSSSHSSANGPTASSSPTNQNNKPTLIRQDRTSTYLVSPQLSGAGFGNSEESATGDDDNHQQNARSAPDIEMQGRHEAPIISVSNSSYGTAERRGSVVGYQLTPQTRCRPCSRECDRRASVSPMSSLQLARSVSKESVRSSTHGQSLSPYLSTHQPHYHPHYHQQQQPQHAISTNIPPVLITSSPTSSRIIRQSSQPEASSMVCCGSHCAHAHTQPSVSLGRLREPGEGIAGIAADSLRISGAMRPFKQVSGDTFVNRCLII
jgi:potassium intermediate/small conductance calcium-activated channel subfamily N member 3